MRSIQWTLKELIDIRNECRKISNPANEMDFMYYLTHPDNYVRDIINLIDEVILSLKKSHLKDLFWEESYDFNLLLKKVMLDDLKNMPLYINERFVPIRLVAKRRLERGY